MEQDIAGRFKVEFIDHGREPKVKSNPAFPNGVDVDGSNGAANTCIATLPYPAPRCGVYVAECRICGVRVAATTAGRPDDPRSIKIACKGMLAA